MNYLTKLYLIVIISIVAIWSVVVAHVVHGADFTYNMTDRLNNESKELQKCISMNAKDNFTKLEIKDCNMIYGGPALPKDSPMDQLKNLLNIPNQKAYGDDTEGDLGLCYRGYKDHCPNANLQHDLEGKLMIWNSLNCSKRDICNVLPSVTKNGGCDIDDEAYNLTGRCDFDWNDTGEESDK